MDVKGGLSEARNVKESQYGKTLLRGPKCDNQELTKTLNYNQSQREHIEAHYDHLRNTFLREIKARPNPTIILNGHRPARLVVRSTAKRVASPPATCELHSPSPVASSPTSAQWTPTQSRLPACPSRGM